MVNFEAQLATRLKKALPGRVFQYKLAPETRPLGEPDDTTIEAGILILIYPDENNCLSTVLMKRPEYDGHHSGQVSFPGGKAEENDKNIIETALRESQEEIGIDNKDVKVLGKLTPLFIPISNFNVHPIVGYTPTKPEFKIDKEEVDYLIECRLIDIRNAEVKLTELKYKSQRYEVPFYDIKNEIVWGATSMIISEFIEILPEIQE